LLFYDQIVTFLTMTDINTNLADNIRRLRESRGLSQQRMSQLSGIPRPTWASLESGAANPTLNVLSKAALALQVSIEELVGAPRTDAKLYPVGSVRQRKRQQTMLRPLLPETIPGLEISRMEIEPGGGMQGIPHTPGTREYLTCERGQVELRASGEKWSLQAGDMLVFRADQHHFYQNPDKKIPAIAISVVCFSNA
jgi:transcriptional regulator with XRE-family HTH domain